MVDREFCDEQGKPQGAHLVQAALGAKERINCGMKVSSSPSSSLSSSVVDIVVIISVNLTIFGLDLITSSVSLK